MKKNDIETLLKENGALIASKLSLHQTAVDRWKDQGVPWKYWDALIKHFNLTLEELHTYNKKVRGL